MTNLNDYTTSFTVSKSPSEVFTAISNARDWWSGDIEGDTAQLGSEFTYEVPGAHWSKQKITELVPGKKIVWHVVDSKLDFTPVKNEWTDTNITFEISPQGDGKTKVNFSHLGLVPTFACYGDCSNAWDVLVGGNLRKLIETGEAQPSPW